ncbi:MAG: hypothetical protein VYB55_04360 [Bacteroidota bacterium]|nr:hypothetical protein [Bacteroidota bacterium]
MMNELEQFKEDSAMKLFGRSREIAREGGQCVKCGEFNLEFRDELSRKEYGISGLCQCCQDMIFGGPEEDDNGEKEIVLNFAHKIFKD